MGVRRARGSGATLGPVLALALGLWPAAVLAQDEGPDTRAISARVAPAEIRSARLRAVRGKLAPIVRSLDRSRFGDGRYFVTLHRTLRPGVSERERIEGLLLRNSGGRPWDDMLVLVAEPAASPTLDHVARLFRFGSEEYSDGQFQPTPEERVRAIELHGLVSAVVAAAPGLVFYSASWFFGDVTGAEGTGFVIVDRATAELVWVRRTRAWEQGEDSLWNTLEQARLVTDGERAEWRTSLAAVAPTGRRRVITALEMVWSEDREVTDWLRHVGQRAASFRGRDAAEQAAFERGAFLLLAAVVGEQGEAARSSPAAGEALLRTIADMPLPAGWPAGARRRLEREARQALHP